MSDVSADNRIGIVYLPVNNQSRDWLFLKTSFISANLVGVAAGAWQVSSFYHSRNGRDPNLKAVEQAQAGPCLVRPACSTAISSRQSS